MVWRLLDRWIVRDLVIAQQEAAGFVPEGKSYEWQGPFVEGKSRREISTQMAGLWSSSSMQMHHLCAANDIPYVHFLQPNQYLPESKPITRKERLVAWDENSPYVDLVPEAYPLLQEAGRKLNEAGIAFHDLSLIFQETETSLYVDSCCHLSPEGSRLLAEAMVERMESTLTAGTSED